MSNHSYHCLLALFTHVYSSSFMFTLVYLCFQLFTRACFTVYTNLLALPMFSTAYSCMFIPVYACVLMFTTVFSCSLCLPLFTCACLPMSTTLYSCLPMFTFVYPGHLHFTGTELKSSYLMMGVTSGHSDGHVTLV